ncbi:hypothetical protein PG991_015593 [Apiospora marii]|uniref:Serine/arginine repetitive matrix protein 1-like n=1 Tax=Apiospora marii TaxID=335849 RepID=A0ABR1R2D0_9PEZI
MAEKGFIQLPPRNGPPPAHHQFPPPQPPLPPMEAVPLELRFRTPQVEVTDVSEHVMSYSEMAAKCTDILVFRFEKCRDNNRQYLDRDEEDVVKSSWEQAIRSRVTSQSQKELSREVRRLDKETDDVLKKKNDLSPALQRQLDRTYSELAAGEHDSAIYQWTLAQIDQQLRPADPANAMFRTEYHTVTRPRKDEGKKHPKKKGKDKSRSRNKSRTKAKKSSSSSKAKHGSYPPSNNVYLERVSLTAYFKRSPRPNVDIAALLQQKKRVQMMTQNAAIHQSQNPQFGGPGPGQGQGQVPPIRAPPPGHHPGHPQGLQGGRGQGPPPNAANRPVPLPPPHLANGPVGGKFQGKKPRVLRQSDSGSSDGSSSDNDSDAGSGSGWSEEESTSTGPTQSTSTTSSSCRIGGRDGRGRSHERGHGHSKNRSKSRGKNRDRSRDNKGKAKGRAGSRSQSRRRGLSRTRPHIYHEHRSAYGFPHGHPIRMHHRPEHPYRRDSEPFYSPRPSFEVPPQVPRRSPPPATPVIVQQQTSEIEIQKIKDQAYLNGRADEQEKQRTLEEMASDFPRPSSRTRGVRHVVHTVESPEPRRSAHRETHRETFRTPRRHHHQEVDSDSSSSWSSLSEEVREYEPDYHRAEYYPRRTHRAGAEYHHFRSHHPRSLSISLVRVAMPTTPAP